MNVVSQTRQGLLNCPKAISAVFTELQKTRLKMKNAFCNVFYTWDQRFLHLGISQQFSKIQTTCDHKSHMHKYMCILVYGSLSTCKCDSLGTHCMLLNTHYKLLDGICIYIDFQHRRSYTVSYFFI